MRLRNIPLRIKLFIVLALVSVLSLAAVYVIATESLISDTKGFLVSKSSRLAQPFREQLAEYYSQNGSWRGVENIFIEHWTIHGEGSGYRGQRGIQGQFEWGEHTLLVDSNGDTIYASSQRISETELSQKALSRGLAIVVDGRQVGYLFTGEMLDQFSELGQTLLSTIRASIAVATLISLVGVVVAGFVLMRFITAPLDHLAKATLGLSQGDLQTPIPSKGTDEIGRLSNVLNNLRTGLARSEEVRQHMLVDIAHELRNPLAVMRVKVEAMLDGIETTSEGNLTKLTDKIQHLSRLVSDLQDIALAEADELPLDRQRLDLRDLLEEVETDAQALLAAADDNVEEVKTCKETRSFQLEIPNSVPPVYADRSRLLQILWNLISNAICHTSSQDSITLAVQPEADEILITVSDTGEGMDEETVTHIFDRFYRAKGKDSSPGLGLGLAITRQLVLAHGGTIKVDSTPEQGTRFSFTIPIYHA